MVDVERVRGHNRSARYIAKYLAKSQNKFRVLKDLGFGRRWSRSIGWPSSQLRLAATERNEWVDIGFYGGTSKHLERLVEIDHRLKTEKSGTQLNLEFDKINEHKMKGRRIKSVLDSLPATF